MRQVKFRRNHCAAARRRNGVVESLEPRRLLSVVPAGPEFGVNTVTDGSQWHVDVASDAAGNSVAVWEGPGPNGGYRAVYAQRYDAAGAPLGGEFLVNEPAFRLGDTLADALRPHPVDHRACHTCWVEGFSCAS